MEAFSARLGLTGHGSTVLSGVRSGRGCPPDCLCFRYRHEDCPGVSEVKSLAEHYPLETVHADRRASAHILASLLMSAAGTSQMALMASGVLSWMYSLSLSNHLLLSSLDEVLVVNLLGNDWFIMPRNRAVSPDGLMGIHQSALAASSLKIGSRTTNLAPRLRASRMSRAPQRHPRPTEGMPPDHDHLLPVER